MGEETAPREKEKKGGRTAAEFEEESRWEGSGGEGEELNRRRWANIAVLRDEGEPRCR